MTVIVIPVANVDIPVMVYLFAISLRCISTIMYHTFMVTVLQRDESQTELSLSFSLELYMSHIHLGSSVYMHQYTYARKDSLVNCTCM